ncbi:MAG: 23S rRNA (uridine(2552)-2'-O)-methyltransferase RlmE [Gammaproteobacteria bacterium]
MSKKRSASSKRWLREHETDPYVQKARREGYRSRAVYKLEELDQRDRLLKPGISIVDLGAAPGGWCQYIERKLGQRVRIVATDILPMDPVAGTNFTFIRGDFREAVVLAQIEAAVGADRVDLVLSDMAPNISGVDAADQAGSVHLAELALEFARARLKPGGAFVVKLFQGEGFDAYLKLLRQAFTKVALRKPKASRPRSREIYLVARGPGVV